MNFYKTELGNLPLLNLKLPSTVKQTGKSYLNLEYRLFERYINFKNGSNSKANRGRIVITLEALGG